MFEAIDINFDFTIDTPIIGKTLSLVKAVKTLIFGVPK